MDGDDRKIPDIQAILGGVHLDGIFCPNVKIWVFSGEVGVMYCGLITGHTMPASSLSTNMSDQTSPDCFIFVFDVSLVGG